jgi:hypothetical protein
MMKVSLMAGMEIGFCGTFWQVLSKINDIMFWKIRSHFKFWGWDLWYFKSAPFVSNEPWRAKSVMGPTFPVTPIFLFSI